MDIKVCDFCGKSIENVKKGCATEGGIDCTIKMIGNGTIREFPFSKYFDINLGFVLCDDCAKKILDTFVKCGQEC
ncbi:MAG: hypothetical protein RSB59_04995, partial [Clostridia bacterium]